MALDNSVLVGHLEHVNKGSQGVELVVSEVVHGLSSLGVDATDHADADGYCVEICSRIQGA